MFLPYDGHVRLGIEAANSDVKEVVVAVKDWDKHERGVVVGCQY
jgi:hypothetical protein